MPNAPRPRKTARISNSLHRQLDMYTLAAGAANAFSPNSDISVASGATLSVGAFNQSIKSIKRIRNCNPANYAARNIAFIPLIPG